MFLIPNGLGPPSQTAHENQATVRSGNVPETAFLAVFDAAVVKRAARVDAGLAETMPEAGVSGDPEDLGKAIAKPTEGGLERPPAGDVPQDTPTAEVAAPHTHTPPTPKDNAPARLRQNPQSSQPVIPHAVNPAPIAAKAPGPDVAPSAAPAPVGHPQTMPHRPAPDQQGPWPKDQKQAQVLPKPAKARPSSTPVDVFETGANLRPAAPQAARPKTGQGTVSSPPMEGRPTPDTGAAARPKTGQTMPVDRAVQSLPTAPQAASLKTGQATVSSPPLEDRPAPDTGAAAQPKTGQALPADRVAPTLPATPQEAKTPTRPAKDKAASLNTETSVKNRADPPQPRHSAAYPPPPQAITPPQAGAMPPTPAAAPMQATAAPLVKAEVTEESLRSPLSHDDVRSDLRLTAEGGPRPAGPLSQAPQAPDLPRHVAQQIVEALQRGGGGKERGIDLLLNPAELGRVRISLSPGDAGLTVHIVADRPETLDLMRRNIDMLAQDFQSIGYDATDFAFAQHAHDEENQGHKAPRKQTRHLTQDAEASPRLTATLVTDRVDIRL